MELLKHLISCVLNSNSIQNVISGTLKIVGLINLKDVS